MAALVDLVVEGLEALQRQPSVQAAERQIAEDVKEAAKGAIRKEGRV